MPNLIVIKFDNEQEAMEARETIRSTQKGGLVSLDDSAVVVKDEHGKIHVKNEVDRGVKLGAGIGGALGLMIGFIFMGPLALLVAGAVGGAAVGALSDLGISKKFVKEVADSLEPGNSALFLIFRGGDPAVALAAFKPYKGEVFHTTLSEEAEESLRQVLKTRK